jgi:hypothetical protein
MRMTEFTLSWCHLLDDLQTAIVAVNPEAAQLGEAQATATSAVTNAPGELMPKLWLQDLQDRPGAASFS